VTDRTASSGVPDSARPSTARAAAAARLAGAADDGDAVLARMRLAARRSMAHSAPAPVSAGGAALAVAAPVRRVHPDGRAQPRPRHLRVVEDTGLTSAQRRRRARFLLVGGIGVAAAIGLALVYFHVVLAQRQFAIDRLDSQVQQAQSTYQDDRLQVAGLGSPQHIISMAEGKLGMIQPASVTYLDPQGGSAAPGTGGGEPLGQTAASPVISAAQAPAGDAAWPAIKSQLAGLP
jgi:hypothetical protein